MKPSIQLLHETFIEKANRPMDLGRSPITPKKPAPTIVPVDRWEEKGDPKSLVKRFQFRRPEDRLRFVTEVLEYEQQVNHHADILIQESSVAIRLITKNIERITELDREYAQYVDAVFKDIVYTP